MLVWYISLEVVGCTVALLLTPTRHLIGAERYVSIHYELQGWWANSLWVGAKRLFRWKLIVRGGLEVPDRPFLLLPRHVSLIDTLLPGVLVANARKKRLRYVLKQELLADPCLRIVGKRLPNLFVDRDGDSLVNRRRVRSLTLGLGEREGLVIYPEGTRFSRNKRERVLGRLRREHSPWLGQAMTLRNVLPPRFGGVEAALQANPALDVVFMSHRGLEGAQSIPAIFRGDLLDRTIEVRFWRVPSQDIPLDADERRAWLYRSWQTMDAIVGDADEVDTSEPAAAPAGVSEAPVEA